MTASPPPPDAVLGFPHLEMRSYEVRKFQGKHIHGKPCIHGSTVSPDAAANTVNAVEHEKMRVPG